MKLQHRTLQRHARRGFTLLEIIVVVTIIALLATLVAPRLLGNVDRARASAAQNGVAQIAQQVSLYMLEHGSNRIPPDFNLEVLVEERLLRQRDLIDPWGNPYILRVPGVENPDFDIISYGADGQPGGEGYDADIVN
jgi:general secretion pathway protein G